MNRSFEALIHRPAARWAAAPVVIALLVAASLEEVTDDPPSLDPRFFAGGGANQAVGPGAGQVPFLGYDGATVAVAGVVVDAGVGALDLDLWKIDTDAPGSRVHLGKLPIPGPGPFSIDVPEGFGGLQIEAVRDLTGDGPSDDDPFGRAECTVGSEPVRGVRLVLEAGALAEILASEAASQGAPQHMDMPEGVGGGAEDHPFVEMPAGAEGGDPEAGGDGEHPHEEMPEGAGGGDPTAEGGEHPHVEMPEGAGGGDPTAEGGEHPHVEAPAGAAGGDPNGGHVHVEMPPGGAEGGGDHPHTEAPPGAPGGGGVVHDPDARPDGAAPPSGGQARPEPFADVKGPKITLSGTIVYGDPAVVMDLDLFRADPQGPGGRVFVGKHKVSAGAFSLQIPVSFEEIHMELFLDATGDGPSADDPWVPCPCNPVSLKRGDVSGIEIRLP